MWFHSVATGAWRGIMLNWSLLTLFIVKPWRFLSATARHISSARTWLATGSTAGHETCNYSSLQRCQSVKDGIHAFILANPCPLPFFCLLTFPPPAPFFLLSHQPPSLFRWAIKERNKCKWSLVWHRSLLIHSLLKYLPAKFLNLTVVGVNKGEGRSTPLVLKQEGFSPGHRDRPLPSSYSTSADPEIKLKARGQEGMPHLRPSALHKLLDVQLTW